MAIYWVGSRVASQILNSTEKKNSISSSCHVNRRRDNEVFGQNKYKSNQAMDLFGSFGSSSVVKHCAISNRFAPNRHSSQFDSVPAQFIRKKRMKIAPFTRSSVNNYSVFRRENLSQSTLTKLFFLIKTPHHSEMNVDCWWKVFPLLCVIIKLFGWNGLQREFWFIRQNGRERERETRIEFYINLLLNCSRLNSFFSSRCQHRRPKRTAIAED